MALLDQRVSLPQIPRSSALPTAHRRSAAAGWCWRRACDRIDPRPRVKMGRKNHHGCDGNPIWSHKYPHGNQGGCTKSCENTITKSINRPGLRWCRALDEPWTGYEDLDSSDAYENRGEGGLKGWGATATLTWKTWEKWRKLFHFPDCLFLPISISIRFRFSHVQMDLKQLFKTYEENDFTFYFGWGYLLIVACFCWRVNP